MNYDLPTTVTIEGTKYPIRSDYRAVLDICQALVDPDLTNEEKAVVVLEIFYEDELPREHWEAGVMECFRFINLGRDEKPEKRPKLMDWGQDFQFIIAPINRVLGCEVRSVPYLHWWTFIAAYYEIGDCTFAQIVRIRDQLKRGKKLDEFDRKWYNEHKDIVDLKITYSEAEKELLQQWGIK